MARTASRKIRNAKQRNELDARPYPYFETIAPRRALGYIRKGGTVAGCWIVRIEIGRTDKGGAQRRQEALGTADDLPGVYANGVDILSYEQARALAAKRQPGGKVGTSNDFTVRDAYKRHLAFRGKHGGKATRNIVRAGNSIRWNFLCEHPDGTPREGMKGLGEVPVNKLTAAMLTAARDALIRHDLMATDERAYSASQASADRAFANFRSCLQQAFEDDDNGIISDRAWRKVKSLGRKGNRRELYLSPEQMQAIIAKVRENGHPAEADLFQAYAYTGARPGGELASLTVADFDAGNGTLSVRERSEQTINKTKPHVITLLDDEAVAFFARIAAGRSQSAPLLSPDGVERWDAKQRQRHFKHILREAGAPEGCTGYTFRHSYISELAAQGVSLHMIATNCGTSVGQIEQVYAKFQADKFRAMVRATARKPAPPPTLTLVANDEQQQEAA